MKLKKALATSVFGIATVFALSSANAFTLNGSGAATLQFSGFTAENKAGEGGIGAGEETTFGGGYVTNIHKTGNPAVNFWASGQGNETLSFILYGIADNSVTPNGNGGFDIKNVGCTVGAGCDGKIHLDFYLDSTGGTNPGFGGAGGLTTADRSGALFGGLTDGTLFMKWEMVAGVLLGDAITTLFQTVNSPTLPASGSGSFYANCVSGAGCANFVPGTQKGKDFFAKFSLSATGPVSDAGDAEIRYEDAYKAGFGAQFSDPVTTTVIPEPGSILLFGLGLLGLLSVKRRRNA